MNPTIEEYARIFHLDDSCGGQIEGATGALSCRECGRRLTLDELRRQFDPNAFPTVAAALRQFESDSGLAD